MKQNKWNRIQKNKDETIQEFKDKFNNQPILDVETLKDAVYQLKNQLQSTLDVVAPQITKKRSKQKSYGMTNNSMTKGEYSKIEKGSNIKCRTPGSHTRGSK